MTGSFRNSCDILTNRSRAYILDFPSAFLNRRRNSSRLMRKKMHSCSFQRLLTRRGRSWSPCDMSIEILSDASKCVILRWRKDKVTKENCQDHSQLQNRTRWVIEKVLDRNGCWDPVRACLWVNRVWYMILLMTFCGDDIARVLHDRLLQVLLITRNNHKIPPVGDWRLRRTYKRTTDAWKFENVLSK